MNTSRILVIAVLGLAATSSYAQVQFTLEGEPCSEWEFAQKDLDGMIRSMNVADADGDGVASFVAEVVPSEVAVDTLNGRNALFSSLSNINEAINAHSPFCKDDSHCGRFAGNRRVVTAEVQRCSRSCRAHNHPSNPRAVSPDAVAGRVGPIVASALVRCAR